MQVARGRLRGCLIVAGALCLLIPIFAAISYGWDALADAPWAYPVWSRQTLTGTWLGQLTAPGGERFAVLMELQRARLSNGDPHDEETQGALMTGSASWCDDRGRHAEGIVIDGAVPVFSGYNGTASDVQISLETAAHRQVGLQPKGFEGAWRLGTLTLQPAFENWTGTTYEYPNAGILHVVFNKSELNAYRAACAVLGTKVP